MLEEYKEAARLRKVKRLTAKLQGLTRKRWAIQQQAITVTHQIEKLEGVPEAGLTAVPKTVG